MSLLHAKKIHQIAVALAAITVFALAGAAAASAANYHDAIRDCFDDGQLEGHYSRHVLQQALRHLPSDEAEYSDCSNVLRGALTASAHRGGGGGSGGPAPPSNPSLTTPSGAQAGSQQAYKDLQKQTSKPGSGAPTRVRIGGHLVKPGVGGVLAAARTGPNKLPTSLLASLIAVAVISAFAGILVIRRRWPETRRVALRLLRR